MTRTLLYSFRKQNRNTDNVCGLYSSSRIDSSNSNIVYFTHLQSMTEFLTDYNSGINNINNHNREI